MSKPLPARDYIDDGLLIQAEPRRSHCSSPGFKAPFLNTVPIRSLPRGSLRSLKVPFTLARSAISIIFCVAYPVNPRFGDRLEVIMNRLAFVLFPLSLCAYAQDYTRGVGVYPGDPREYTGPALVVNANSYRNLAQHRPVYQSSAYDYNLTAQLVTDGIKETAAPEWLETSTSDAGVLPKRERELFLDGNVTSSVDVSGSSPWVQFDMHGGQPPEIDRLDLYLRKASGFSGAWTYVVS